LTEPPATGVTFPIPLSIESAVRETELQVSVAEEPLWIVVGETESVQCQASAVDGTTVPAARSMAKPKTVFITVKDPTEAGADCILEVMVVFFIMLTSWKSVRSQ
jgi:hypothetical protein